MEKKRILFVYRNLVLGGAERVLIDLLGILVKNPCYEVTLMLIADQDLRHFKIPEGVIVKNILTRMEAEFEIFSILKCQSGENPEYFGYWVNRGAEEANQRIFHHLKHHYYHLIINFEDHFDAFLAKYDLHPSIPIIRWVHAAWYFDRWQNNPEWFRPILEKQNPFVIIAENMRSLAEQTFSQLGLENKIIEQIYNPIDIARIQSLMHQPREEDSALLSDDYILQVGRLDAVKNQLQLIDIYAKLKAKGIKEKLYIIGGGNEYDKLQQRIAELGLETECLLLGHNANPYPFMRNAKLFLHTALSEGFGLVLLESQICGTAVVAMDCPVGPKEILENGKSGKLVPLYDEVAFIDATVELLNNEVLRNQYREAGFENIKRFSFEEISCKIFAFFDSLMAR